MKPVKNLVFATLLVCTIALNTFAGDVDQPGNPSPPHITMTEETPTDTSTNTQQITAETSDYLIFKTLEVLLSVY